MRNPFELYTSFTNRRGTRQLDWEESALDTQTQVEGFFDEHRAPQKFTWLQLLILLCCILLGARLFNLQVMRGTNFGALALGNKLRDQTLLAPRGLIKDRYGKILAQNTPSFALVAIPVDLPRQGLQDEIGSLASFLKIPIEDLAQPLKNFDHNSLAPIMLKQDLSQADTILFKTQASQFLGFSVITVPVRDYLEPKIFSHVLGYTGLVSGAELGQLDPSRYAASDFIGKSGIELSYEGYLHGSNGSEQIEVDAFGKPVKTLGTKEPEPGNIAELNIDKELQEQLYNNFYRNGGVIKGAAIALNPKNGQVLALLSLPGFDNNMFAGGISQQNYEKLLSDKTLPLFNRVVSGTYPPGSTVKPMVALAALEEHVVSENTLVVDRGVLVIPNQFDASKSYNFYGWKREGLGPVNVTLAIAKSSDIYFYTVAGGHTSSQIKPLGPNRLANYYRKFHLGQISGIDLQGEKSGLVADPAWKAEYFKGDAILSKWYLGDTYHIGIGQGDMVVTPLQVALWTAVIANNGVGYKPNVLDRIVDQAGKMVYQSQPEIIVPQFASDKNIKIIQEGMRQTVVAGSGVQLSYLPITAAGKTGTSQFDSSDSSRTHAWFTAYAPFEDPQIVITVLVEAGGEGHAAAVPIVKNVLQWWAQNRYKTSVKN